MNDKINKDPLYKKLWEATNSTEVLTQAGFFDDKISNLEYNTNLITTPLDKIKKTTNLEPVVLLTTGGFAPVHKGHIYMMESAKDCLTKHGYEVVGGYFSPSHDSYVHSKYPGSDTLNIYEKIEILRKAVNESDFLMVDPWEGLYTPSAINFTDVIYRLEAYLLKHLGFKVKIAYVFGGDNSGFARVFKNSNYLAVCVNRDHKNFNLIKEELKNENNIFFIQQNPYSELSSRIISKFPEHVDSNLPYLVRDDLSLYNIEPYWSEKLISLIQSFTNCSVYKLLINKQQQFVDKITKPFLNLDPLVSGGIKVEVSRIFSLSNGQYRSNQLINRPHSIPLSEQMSRIPPGEYYLIEDDVASGFTINYLKSILPKQVKIIGLKTLTEDSFYQIFSSDTPFKFLDIVDMRDFILGLNHGGLVVNLPNGQIGRAIYALPFVNLASRAKIDPKLVVKMSKSIWELNAKYYSQNRKQVKDLDLYTKNLLIYLGFNPEDLVKYVCEQMIRIHYV